MAAHPSARFLDPAVLGRISSLHLLAKTVVEGFISGLHRSPFLGRSMDFAEYRSYVPGDDIRQIDWKLYSRSDRFFVKVFEGDTNTNLLLLLDVSRSMDFGTAPMSKLDYARSLLACLGYFGSKQRDRVGLATFADDVIAYVPPAAKHLEMVLRTLDEATASGSSGLKRPLLRVAERVRRRSIVVLVSDFYEPPEKILEAVSALKVRGNDLILFHLLDPAEIDLTFDQPSELVDLETGERLPVVPDQLREQYCQLVSQHIAELKRRFTELGVNYALVNTSEPLDSSLYRFLSARLWSMKSR